MIVRKLRNMIVSELVNETVRNRLGRDGKSTPRLSSFICCGLVVWFRYSGVDGKEGFGSVYHKQAGQQWIRGSHSDLANEEGIRGLRNESSQFVGKEGQGVHLIYLLKLDDGSERLKFW